MSYADPQTILALTLPRVSADKNSGAFQTADGLNLLTVSHQNGKRFRSSIRLTQAKVSADPYVPAQNVRSSMSAYLVVDRPVNGWTVAEAKVVVDGLVAYLTASTGARVTQLLGGEQ